MPDTTEIAPDELPHAAALRKWTEHISWGATLALAWMIYEITARPSFGIAVACVKIGWNDFLTAHWLLWRDPLRKRGSTCFVFYMASGLWKMTIAAFLLTGVILTVALLLDDKVPRGVKSLGLLAALGVLLLAVVPMLGVALARWHGLKIWIDSTVHQSRRENFFPPLATGRNLAAGLLFPALIVPIVLTAILTVRLGPWLMFLSLFAAGLLIWQFFRGVSAGSPAECWAELAFESADDEDLELEVVEFDDDTETDPQ